MVINQFVFSLLYYANCIVSDYSLPNGTLTIESADYNATGDYQCMAMNSLGRGESKKVNISVKCKSFNEFSARVSVARDREDVAALQSGKYFSSQKSHFS